MKKIILCLSIMLLASFNAALANTKTPAKDITVNTSSFDKNLSDSDDTVQKALQTVNDLNLGSGSVTPGGNQGEFQYNNGGNFAGGSMLYTDGINIGISDSTPEEKLTVGGNIKSSGNITSLNIAPGSEVSGVNTGDQIISDSTISLSDITTNDLNIDRHGFAPKLPNDVSKYLDGTGAWSVPSGGGGGSPWIVNGSSIYYSTGNVGIGTANPQSLFSLGSTGLFQISSSGSISKVSGQAVTLSNSQLSLFNAGNVDIKNNNSSSSAYLNLIGGAHASSYVNIIPTTAAGVGAESIRFSGGSNGGTEWGRFQAGNFGVGTPSPTQKLQVVGTAQATTFSGSGSGLTGIPDGGLTLTDVTTNNASTSNHGFLKKLDNDSSHYMDGTGNWSTPAGGGGGSGTVSTGTVGGLAVYTGTTTVGSSSVITQTGSNIGVNTTSPAYNMEVVGSLGATSINTSGTGQAQMSSVSGIAFDGNSAVMGTPDLVIATTTNVGIGTSTPTEKLHVVGNVLATTFSGSGASLTAIPDGGLTLTDVTTNNASTSKHGFLPKLNNDSTYFLDGTGAWAVPAGGGGASGWTDGGTNVYVTTTTDRVGIGTTTPGANNTLEIVKQSSLSPFAISSTASGNGDLFNVKSSGNVGIGTINPQNVFSVGSTGQFGVDTTGAIKRISGQAVTVSNSQLSLTNAGNVDIKNSNSSSGSYVNLIGGANAGSYVNIQATSGTGVGAEYIKFTYGSNGATESMRINGSGNLGIGTASPVAKLDINGTSSKIRMQSADGTFWNCQPANTTGVFTCI